MFLWRIYPKNSNFVYNESSISNFLLVFLIAFVRTRKGSLPASVTKGIVSALCEKSYNYSIFLLAFVKEEEKIF